MLQPHTQDVARHCLLLELEPVPGHTHGVRVDVGDSGAAGGGAGADRDQVTDLKLGWEAYGGNGNTVWLDDVALHTSRIGCGS